MVCEEKGKENRKSRNLETEVKVQTFPTLNMETYSKAVVIEYPEVDMEVSEANTSQE